MGRDWAKVWVEQGRFQAYFPRLSFAKDGLKLGAGTVIAVIERDRSGVACLKIDGAEDAPRRLFLADHLLADGLDEGRQPITL